MEGSHRRIGNSAPDAPDAVQEKGSVRIRFHHFSLRCGAAEQEAKDGKAYAAFVDSEASFDNHRLRVRGESIRAGKGRPYYSGGAGLQFCSVTEDAWTGSFSYRYTGDFIRGDLSAGTVLSGKRIVRREIQFSVSGEL